MTQLLVVDDKLDIDQPATRQLGVEWPLGRLVPRHLAAHCENVMAQLFTAVAFAL